MVHQILDKFLLFKRDMGAYVNADTSSMKSFKKDDILFCRRILKDDEYERIDYHSECFEFIGADMISYQIILYDSDVDYFMEILD